MLRAINTARADARARAWQLAGTHAPSDGVTVRQPLAIDVDATLVTAHSDKENAKPTFKKGYGCHPLCVFVDHGQVGTGEPLAILLRPGNAGSNTAADHITVLREAFNQLPEVPDSRPGKRLLVRVDGAGHSHKLVEWLTGQRVQYSVGFTLPGDAATLIEKIPATVWTPAYDADRMPRHGAWVAELTGLLNLTGWPAGMRVIIRKERPHPGAQLTITDVDGHRITAFATNPHRPTRRPRTPAPPTSPLRGPDPARQGHRADQPAPARLHPEPDLVRHRRPRRRADRLDATPRLHRHRRPPLGTQTAPLPTLHHPHSPRPRRTPTAAPLRRPPPLGHPPHRRPHRPDHPGQHLTEPPTLTRQAETPTGPLETRAHRSTSGKPSHPPGTIRPRR